MNTPYLRLKCGSKEIGDVPDSITKAYELSVQEARLRLTPEQVAGMAIMMNKCLWTFRKKMQRAAAVAGIVDS